MLMLFVTAAGSLAVKRPGIAVALMLLLGKQSIDVGFSFPLVALPLISAFAAAVFRDGTVRLPPAYLLVPLVWFSVYALLRPLFSSGSEFTLDVNIGLFVLLALVPMTIVTATLATHRDTALDFARMVVALGIGLSAIAIATSSGARSGALGGGPITLAQTAALGVVFLAANFAGIRDGLSRWIYFPPMLFLAYAVVWSQSRGPTIALAVALASLLSVRRTRKLPTARLMIVVIALLQGFRVLGSYGLLPRRLALLTTFQGEVARSRGIVWDPAVLVIRENPIFGCGAECYFAATGAEFTYPHNILLEGQIVGGVIGFILIGWALYGIMSRLGRWNAPGFCVMLVPILSAMLSGDLYNNRAIWIVGLFVLASGQIDTPLADTKVASSQSSAINAQGNRSSA